MAFEHVYNGMMKTASQNKRAWGWDSAQSFGSNLLSNLSDVENLKDLGMGLGAGAGTYLLSGLIPGGKTRAGRVARLLASLGAAGAAGYYGKDIRNQVGTWYNQAKNYFNKQKDGYQYPAMSKSPVAKDDNPAKDLDEAGFTIGSDGQPIAKDPRAAEYAYTQEQAAASSQASPVSTKADPYALTPQNVKKAKDILDRDNTGDGHTQWFQGGDAPTAEQVEWAKTIVQMQDTVDRQQKAKQELEASQEGSKFGWNSGY